MRIKLFLTVLVFTALSLNRAFAATPAPEPKVTWVSGAYGLKAMVVGETCWGDSIGPYAGPVVIKATSPTPRWGMVNAACAIEPSISVWARLEWAKLKYKEGRLWWGSPTNGTFSPTPTAVPTTAVPNAPTNLWSSGNRQAKTKAVIAGEACWGNLVRGGTQNHYNKLVEFSKPGNVLVSNGFCATYTSSLSSWIFKSTNKTYSYVKGN